MCGIAGVLAFKNSNFEVTADYLLRMRDAMAHRGPDGAGLWISPKPPRGPRPPPAFHHRPVPLGCTAYEQRRDQRRRNAATGVQRRNLHHAEIRRELESQGHRSWQTHHSDSEVVLQAFAAWGIACLHKFRGMFAIAIWDATARRLWLIRDRIGIKPLYYSLHHGRITFGSEIKSLLQDAGQTRTVNEEAFFHYLSVPHDAGAGHVVRRHPQIAARLVS